MIATHRIPHAHFDDLMTGGGSAPAIGLLRDGQYSLTLVRLRAMLEIVHGRDAHGLRHASGAADARYLTAAFDLLGRAAQQRPEAGSSTLLHPQVGAWAGKTLRLLRRGGARQTAASGGHPGQLAAIAAVAAIGAGIDFEIDVPMHGGAVMLPGLGMAHLPRGGASAAVRGGNGSAEIAAGRDIVLIPAPGASAGDAVPGWQELRRLKVAAEGSVLDVILDDLDPFRDCHGLGAAGRLPTKQVTRWQSLLTEAWQLLARDHAAFAEGIAAGLTSLVPLISGPGGRGMSATSADAFGACALSQPADAVALAATLVHEFQHGKLSALHNLIPLHRSGPQACFYSPWRDDPRPLWGLMHGAYAFLGVTDFWLRRRKVDPQQEFAHFEFARWREQTKRALCTIAESRELTSEGERFAAGMLAHAGHWDDPVPPRSHALALGAMADHEVSWLLRNVVPDSVAVERLAVAWLAGEAPPSMTVSATVMASQRALEDNARMDLTYLLLRDPPRFAALSTAVAARISAPGRYTDADTAYARGDLGAAARAYRKQVVADPDRLQAWSGLALALRDEVLLTRPALVAAVYHAAVRRDRPGPAAGQPDPEKLAAWLFAVSLRQTAGGSMSKS